MYQGGARHANGNFIDEHPSWLPTRESRACARSSTMLDDELTDEKGGMQPRLAGREGKARLRSDADGASPSSESNSVGHIISPLARAT